MSGLDSGLNGVAHVILTAGDFPRSTAFWRQMIAYLGLKIVLDSEHMLYGVGVRTAIGDDSVERLAKEESFYRDLHKGYRDHFDRLGEPEGTGGVAASDREDAQAKLDQYDALDVIVVRGLASAKVEPMVKLAEDAAP